MIFFQIVHRKILCSCILCFGKYKLLINEGNTKNFGILESMIFENIKNLESFLIIFDIKFTLPEFILRNPL